MFGRSVEQATGGQLRVKVYLGGIAGDEVEEGERLRKGQLDLVASAHMLCQRISPSMRILRLPGLFQDRDESREILNRLQPIFDAEAHERGFIIPGTTAMGAETIFTRVPVHSMTELRKLKLWRWNLDEVAIAADREMGLDIVPLPIEEAGRAYDEGRIDGFFVIPTAAIAFQFSVRAHYFTDLRMSYFLGCPIFSERTFGALPSSQQAVLREAIASLRERTDAIGRQSDEALLGGLFKRQGMVMVEASERFRAEFFAAARAARERTAERFVARPLLDRVVKMLLDYRSEHGRR
jgi:TRAP-type C4-dicarboxylate transport system substrate-binding protein